jgi:two-component system cell cycle response regulator
MSIRMADTNDHEFRLSLFGFNRVERMTVTSVCSLTQRRERGYAVLPGERNNDAHIALVDVDDAAARDQWRQSLPCQQGRPALMIGRDAAALQTVRYGLPRANFASRLVKLLDQITIREFQFMPGVMVGDNAPTVPAVGGNAFVEPVRASMLSKGRSRVLVVDDALVVRTQMRALLDLHKVEAVLAPDAEQAVQLMQTHGPFSLVFLDVVLPGMDGYAACRKLKSIDRDVPVIMLTGKDSAFDKIRGVMAGCNRYLTKPVAVEALSKVLQEYLEKQAASHQVVRA